ncbi:MAG: hypothetical protein MUF10_13365 [Thermoanaerobaculaceae bacterium]|jgi:hypothetical protein|nr:hypothetical protein [Thermoanaerobaculaceae bacterium]
MRPRPLLTAFAVVLATGWVSAQGINPDISVIGDVRAFVTGDPNDSKKDELQLDLHGAELALGGYLNPFARADVYIGYHDDEIELEEAYATILRGLPGRLQLKAGKYRVDFGKLNLLHPHAYSFLDTPLVHQVLLGEEGLIDIGVNLNTQIPIGSAALTLSGNVLKGDFSTSQHHADEDEHAHAAAGLWARQPFVRSLHDDIEIEEEAEPGLGYSERLGLYIPTGDYAGFEVGLNALQGTFDRGTGRQVRLLGADLKYRWAPDKYHSLTVQGEWIRSERDLWTPDEPLERTTASGFYAFIDYRFAQRWNTGVVAERAEGAYDPSVTTERAGVFGGFQLMEETTMLRLLLRRTDGDALEKPVDEAILQLVFSLGPHKAHWF